MAEFKLEKKCVFEHPFFNLYHYQTEVDNLHSSKELSQLSSKERKPLLITYALVNRPWILDLLPQRSFIYNLCRAGFDVYLIDWGYPTRNAAKLTLKNYALDFVNEAVEAVLQQHQCNQLNLLGVCQGGVFNLCYAAWRPEAVAKLISVVTPVNFQTQDNLITPRVSPKAAQAWVNELGNFPGAALNWFLTMLKPEHTLINKFNRFLHIKDDPKELKVSIKMEQWIHDTPDHPGQAFMDFLNDFYLENSLMKTSYHLDGEHIQWSSLSMPVLNIYALQDHLVPPSAAKALQEVLHFNKNYEEVAIEAGHIGLMIGRKNFEMVPVKICDWLLK